MHQITADLADFLPRLEEVARSAGDIAMRYFRLGERTSAAVSYKGGGSPVTEADLAVDRFLFEETRKLAPQAAWLSEETRDDPARLSCDSLVVVDPIDGTTAFARGDKRWAISIALIEKGRPVAGVVHAPAKEETFVAARGFGAALNGVRLDSPQRAKLDRARLVAPKGVQERAARLGFSIAPRSPSLALRLVDLAAGRHDIVVAAPNARDWDIAAADIVLEEAGAVLCEPDGAKLTYNRASLARRMLVAAPNSLLTETLALTRAVSQEGRG
ncbi:MAG: 3'(2'),5'-bisphosphate nucleotidase CysQ [Methylocystis sp.]|nr:3'(2'),5'-bisphosphate nucleotidase CysQ [Methylocystis sp.]